MWVAEARRYGTWLTWLYLDTNTYRKFKWPGIEVLFCDTRSAYGYAAGIISCLATGVKTNWESRFRADNANRPRYIVV
jgi:hypothetical protein